MGQIHIMRVAIAGSPKAGKTTYTETLPGIVKHTDDLIELGWSEASEAASLWFDDYEIDVIEGVAVPRALRKWLERNKENTNKPIDKVFYFYEPFIELSDGQDRMRKGNVTVWKQVKKDLEQRGVIIQEYHDNNRLAGELDPLDVNVNEALPVSCRAVSGCVARYGQAT